MCSLKGRKKEKNREKYEFQKNAISFFYDYYGIVIEKEEEERKKERKKRESNEFRRRASQKEFQIKNDIRQYYVYFILLY